jgi:Holliday junction resolvase RusA-like endonuclease
VRFFVRGTPVPQGSLRSFAHQKTGKVVTPQSNKVLVWRDLIIHEAQKHVTVPFDGALIVECVFWMPRPKSHYGTGRNSQVLKPSAPTHHVVRPDLDKLFRCVGDALVYAGVMHDDSQIVEGHKAKTWAGQTLKAGVHVDIRQAAEWFGGLS